MKKILRIEQSPLTFLPDYANELSILLQFEAGYEWYLQNYFLTMHEYSEETNSLASEFVNLDIVKFAQRYHIEPQNIHSPGIQTYTLPRKFVLDFFDIIDLIKYFITNSMYLKIYVKREYIRKHNMTSTHQMFVYGFDDEKQTVNVADYFSGTKYEYTECSYEEIRIAFKNAEDYLMLDDGICYENENYSLVVAFKYNDHFEYVFSLEKLVHDIDFYIKERDFTLNYRPKIHNTKDESYSYVTGNEIYTILEKYILTRIDKSEWIDKRQILFLKDHKLALKDKILYLERKGLVETTLHEEIDFLINSSSLLSNWIMKYNMTRGKKTADGSFVKDKLYEMCEREKNMLLKIKDRIK